MKLHDIAPAPNSTKSQKRLGRGIGSGLGKTHLLQAIGHYILFHKSKMKVKYIKAEEFVNVNMERKKRNKIERDKRLSKKLYTNDWNYFVTFTYDGSKLDEASFQKKLKTSV